MGWYEDDEMMRQWKETSKEEEKIVKCKMEGKSPQVEGVQWALEPQESQVVIKGEVQKKEKKKSKLKGRSTDKMEKKASKQEFRDTEEMVQWRSINQKGLDNLWKELCEQMEAEVSEKYNVEENKKGACKGRGEPLEWRFVQRIKKYQLRKWSEDCWAIIFSWFRTIICNESKACRRARRKRRR